MTQSRANQPPAFNDGENLLKVPASQWRRVIAAVQAVENMSGNLVTRYGDRIDVSAKLNRQTGGGSARSSLIAVAITEKPTSESKRLRVREVQYDGNDGPITDTGAPYKFVGVAFDALPYVGVRAKEYDGFEFTGATPTQAATYFDARAIGSDRWMLSAPVVATGTRFAVVKQAGDTGEKFVIVREVQLKITNNVVSFVEIGSNETVLCYPFSGAQHFRELVVRTSTPQIVQLVLVGGVWYAMQTIRWATGTRPTQIQEEVCP